MNEPQTEDYKTRMRGTLEKLKEQKKTYQECIAETQRAIDFIESNPDLDISLLRKILIHATSP